LKTEITRIIALLAFCCTAQALANTITIYHDADYSIHAESAQSMAMGFKTALAEVDNQIQGYDVNLMTKDHRGNSKRSLHHMRQFLDDPTALFVLGGLHSPPYIQNRDFINQNGVLLLVPWAAGGPITRYGEGTNWVFRLSIDDTKAGYRIAEFAVDEKNCRQPHLLLEETPWGKSNFKTLSSAINHRLNQQPGVTWFGWNTKANSARILLREARQKGADCLLFVGNAIEGEQFANAMASLRADQRIPIISHWGITGGDFHARVTPDLRQHLDLHFIQTCFSFMSPRQTTLSNRVLEQAKKLFPGQIEHPGDITAPPGFIHAYDLGRIVIAALEQVELSGDSNSDRIALRNALEQLQQPVEGLVKTYQTPFSAWSAARDDAHEALGLEDFCMARFDDQNRIIVNSID
jgi:branched-chain amino acid transport system substrate-binding protein